MSDSLHSQFSTFSTNLYDDAYFEDATECEDDCYFEDCGESPADYCSGTEVSERFDIRSVKAINKCTGGGKRHTVSEPDLSQGASDTQALTGHKRKRKGSSSEDTTEAKFSMRGDKISSGRHHRSSNCGKAAVKENIHVVKMNLWGQRSVLVGYACSVEEAQKLREEALRLRDSQLPTDLTDFRSQLQLSRSHKFKGYHKRKDRRGFHVAAWIHGKKFHLAVVEDEDEAKRLACRVRGLKASAQPPTDKLGLLVKLGLPATGKKSRKRICKTD